MLRSSPPRPRVPAGVDLLRRYTKLFAERFPRVKLVPDVLYVDEGQLLTSAGLTTNRARPTHERTDTLQQ